MIILDSVEWNGRRLAIDPPLAFDPVMNEESGQLYRIIDEDLGIDVFAPTREQLVNELIEQMFFTWDAYAQEVPEKLTFAARRLQEALLKRVRRTESNDLLNEDPWSHTVTP